METFRQVKDYIWYIRFWKILENELKAIEERILEAVVNKRPCMIFPRDPDTSFDCA